MAILRDLTKKPRIELCHYCDEWLFPSGKMVSPDDKDARRQPDGSLKCGVCVREDAKKLLGLFNGGETKEMTEEKKDIYTMDDPEYYKLPPIKYEMSDEMKARNDRDYPTRYDPYFNPEEYLNKASYLRYKCHYCAEEFFLISPYREKGKNPYNEGFMVRPETGKSKNKNVVFACRPCLLDLHNQRESIWISGI